MGENILVIFFNIDVSRERSDCNLFFSFKSVLGLTGAYFISISNPWVQAVQMSATTQLESGM